MRADVAGRMTLGVGQAVLDLVATEPVEDLVLLVGEHSLDLAGAGHDQRHQHLVAHTEGPALGGVHRLVRLGLGVRALAGDHLGAGLAQLGEQVVDRRPFVMLDHRGVVGQRGVSSPA